MKPGKQFDLYRTGGRAKVVVLQSDRLDGLETRMVAPLTPAETVGSGLSALNPKLVLGEDHMVVLTQLMTTLRIEDLGEPVGSLSREHDDMLSAMSVMFEKV